VPAPEVAALPLLAARLVADELLKILLPLEARFIAPDDAV